MVSVGRGGGLRAEALNRKEILLGLWAGLWWQRLRPLTSHYRPRTPPLFYRDHGSVHALPFVDVTVPVPPPPTDIRTGRVKMNPF